MAEATETAQTQTEAPTSPEAITSLLGDVVKTETTETQTETTQEPVKEPEVKVEGAPEKYEFKAPEGKEYDAGILSSFEAAARESNLTQDAAQKLLDTMSPKIQERQAEQVNAIRREWAEQSKSDKEFGGDKLEVNLATAKKAYDTFATPELKTLLDSTGLGNHPEVIRMLYKVGKAISEDTFVSGSASTQSRANRLDVLYDKTPKE